MKKLRIFAALACMLCLVGCSRPGKNEIQLQQPGEREQTVLNAFADDALVFALGEGEYEAALYCYTGGEWLEAGAMGIINGGRDMLFGTQNYGLEGKLLPDAWTVNADGGTMTAYMPWDVNVDISASIFQHVGDKLQLEPGVETMLAVRAFTNDSTVGSFAFDLGTPFSMETEDFAQYSHAWVFTVKAL